MGTLEVDRKESLTDAITSDSPASLGSCMKAPPVLLFGGSSPVVAYLRHSIMVYRESAGHVVWADLSQVGESTYSFARAVPTDDEGEGCIEDDGLALLGSEGADAGTVSVW